MYAIRSYYVIDQKRNDLKQAKAERKAKRDLAKQELNSTAFTQLEKQLVRESNLNKQALKSFIKSEEEKISSIKAEIKDFEAQIQTLRTHRKENVITSYSIHYTKLYENL